MKRLLCLAATAALALSACGERDQVMTSGNTNRGDVPAWHGAKDPFVAKGWNPGSKESWETQLRTRGQSQNEYLKTN